MERRLNILTRMLAGGMRRFSPAGLWRRFRVTQTEHTDKVFWADKRNYRDAWSERARLALSLCVGEDLWLCDLGCGQQQLRPLLPAGYRYLPMDLVAWTADTLVCDINAGFLPTAYLDACDVCLLLGVIEYVHDPAQLFRRLGETVPALVFSCHMPSIQISGSAMSQRRHVNIRSQAEAHALARDAGFFVAQTIAWKPDHIVVKAINTRPPTADRRTARAAIGPDHG